jgi:hypothetical protein
LLRVTRYLGGMAQPPLLDCHHDIALFISTKYIMLRGTRDKSKFCLDKGGGLHDR